MAADRHCCDGACTRGLRCPAFAPGVVDGPYRSHKGLRGRLRAVWRVLRNVLTAGWA